jgi:3'-phosphoadenosine 5'-phosphosulfate sulfotransferase (PAPS reductase)/FAD synthetase
LVPANQLVVVHAPLGRVEWPGTLAHIGATIGDLPLILARTTEDLLAMVRRRGFWPTPAIRQCTSDKKRSPIERELRRYLAANPHFGERIVNCMGLRADESTRRAKRAPLSFSARNSKAGRHWLDWLPIHDWTEDRVLSEIAAAGERPHWAYAAGMTRCSCSFCIMATARDLRRTAQLRQRLATENVALEEEIGHTLRPTRRPLREIIAS